MGERPRLLLGLYAEIWVNGELPRSAGRPSPAAIQGFNIRRWSDRGLNYWAVSDIGADELNEFGDKFEAAVGNNKEG